MRIFLQSAIAAAILLSAAAIAQQGSYLARPVYNHDGDTLVICQPGHQCLKPDGKVDHKQAYSIRIWGIDAPELRQNYGKASQVFLGQLMADQQVQLECVDVDRYRRLTCFVYDENGNDLGAKMVEFGYAFDYTHYSKGRYKKQEDLAKRLNLGVWLNKVQNPEAYRRELREGQK